MAIGLLVGERLLEELIVAAALVLACLLGRAAFAIHTELPRVPAPVRPVVFFNRGAATPATTVVPEAR